MSSTDLYISVVKTLSKGDYFKSNWCPIREARKRALVMLHIHLWNENYFLVCKCLQRILRIYHLDTFHFGRYIYIYIYTNPFTWAGYDSRTFFLSLSTSKTCGKLVVKYMKHANLTQLILYLCNFTIYCALTQLRRYTTYCSCLNGCLGAMLFRIVLSFSVSAVGNGVWYSVHTILDLYYSFIILH